MKSWKSKSGKYTATLATGAELVMSFVHDVLMDMDIPLFICDECGHGIDIELEEDEIQIRVKPCKVCLLREIEEDS